MGLLGAAHRYGTKSPPPSSSLKSVTYIPQCWNLAQQVILYTHIVIHYPSYTLNSIQKIYKSLNWDLSFLTSVFLQRKSLTFVISRNADIGCIFINMVAIFMMSAKLATLGLLKVKVF